MVGIRIIAAATLVVVAAGVEAIAAHCIVHQLLYLLELLHASPRTLVQPHQRQCAPAGIMDGTPTTAEDRTGGRMVDRVVDRMVDRMVDRTVDRMADRMVDRTVDRMADRMVRHHRRLSVTAPPQVVAEATVHPQCQEVQHVLPRRPSCQRACVRIGIMGGTIFRA